MLSLEEINNTIEDLENGSTTFDACAKLASLYIVRDNLLHKQTETGEQKEESQLEDHVESELNDILPQYKTYCEVKRRYQLNEVTEKAVYTSMQDVCREIHEFISILYSSTDTTKEREMIKNLIDQLHGTF